ncbi:MAG: MlaD family protein, partial [Bacteroidales bacterium]|nr:MlaD family protein [Bacteroidales bacterium]
MKIKTEVRIGIIVLTTFLVVYWGINYLKGRNLLKKTDVYYAVFNNVQGLDLSSGVLLNGYKVGLISGIDFQKESLNNINVSFTVNHNFDIPKGSVVELISPDLLGSKAL